MGHGPRFTTAPSLPIDGYSRYQARPVYFIHAQFTKVKKMKLTIEEQIKKSIDEFGSEAYLAWQRRVHNSNSVGLSSAHEWIDLTDNCYLNSSVYEFRYKC